MMALQRGRRWLLATGIFLVAGYVGVSADDENELTPEYGTPHPECSYFGPQRERFLRTELGRSGEGLSLSAITEQVVGALPPSRSRTDPNRDTRQENYIDQYIFAALKRAGVAPAEPAGDAEFLRRVSLDLTGRILSGRAVAEFVADPSPDKRARAIDQLLETPEWADRWAMFFGELYRNTINTAQLKSPPAGARSVSLLHSGLAAGQQAVPRDGPGAALGRRQHL